MATKESWLHIDKPELRDLSIAILALAFAFSWKFAGPATFGNWTGNFILVLFLVLISVFVHEIVHRFVAKKYHARVTSKLFMSSVIAMLIIVVLTNGNLVIAVPWAVSIIPLYFYRPGRASPHLGPYESAFIAAAGPLSNFFMAVVAKLLIPQLGLIAQKLMVINISLAVFNLIPFLTVLPTILAQTPALMFGGKRLTNVPYVEGEFVFFGSRLLWLFTFAFVLVAGLCLFITGILASVIIALIVAAVLWVLWHFWEPELLPGQEKTIPVSWQEYYKNKFHKEED